MWYDRYDIWYDMIRYDMIYEVIYMIYDKIWYDMIYVRYDDIYLLQMVFHLVAAVGKLVGKNSK